MTSPFERTEQEARFQEMYNKTNELIALFKTIIENEKIRAENLSNQEVIELKDATK